MTPSSTTTTTGGSDTTTHDQPHLLVEGIVDSPSNVSTTIAAGGTSGHQSPTAPAAADGTIQDEYNGTAELETCQTKFETSALGSAAGGMSNEDPNVIKKTTPSERWRSGLEESWKVEEEEEERDNNDCKESIPLSTIPKDNRGSSPPRPTPLGR